MNRRSAIHILFVAGAGSFLAPRASGSPVNDPHDFVIRTEVRLVLLDVSVKDRDGALVPSLSRENFAVFENGVPQRITVFANEDLPVTVGILVDESRSMGPKRAEVLSAAESFIAGGNPHDEIFVLNFNERVKRGLAAGVLFSDDPVQLRAALDRGFPEGRTALYDALAEGLQQLAMGKRDKKALLVISDGGDNASYHTRGETMDGLERSIATVYAIGLFNPEDPDRNPGVLKQLAGISGGEAYFPTSGEQMTDVCRAIAREIRSRYTIGYLPAAANGSALRHIRVSVTAPGRLRLSVRTRTRYRFDKTEN